VTTALTGSAAQAAAGAIVVTSKTWLWYVTRSTGLIALILLTATMALGLLGGVRWQRPGWPRFVTSGLHRNMSALACAVVVVHIATTLAEGFVPIYIQDAVLPFGSAYRPLWLGLGAASFDLMLVLIVTSMARTRLSYRAWRALHWTAYLCWPAAVAHGLGTGTDTPVRWVLLLTVACIAVIAGLLGWRLAYAWPR
jgi:methionine sulfoxide reductase heme-binding subunit